MRKLRKTQLPTSKPVAPQISEDAFGTCCKIRQLFETYRFHVLAEISLKLAPKDTKQHEQKPQRQRQRWTTLQSRCSGGLLGRSTTSLSAPSWRVFTGSGRLMTCRTIQSRKVLMT